MELKEIANLLLGFFLGVFGSWLFWKYLLFLQPRVKISRILLKGSHHIRTNEIVYRIKIYNSGRRQVVDLVASATVVRVKEKNRYITLRELKLSFDGQIPSLGAVQDFGNPLHAISPVFHFQILDEINLEGQLADDEWIFFTLSARDALSGTDKVQRVAFNRDNIKKGKFLYGLTFDIAEHRANNSVGAD
ncbi:hypothetical protein NIES2135_58150 [Leptolyngbya boryana NIES-2135]|uniref:Uncharacterized protein n=1 Tax=Leptolyngbya boryana NIES-2135 TaxID=1973484 RepID=A0A1Z4JQF9_LEPBY|nr:MULTISPECIES: hypothetical protein [Leptolyngbya]BAY58940.1 hypothetical protein NIES2135_58150 [Leptolyngbya boryana NIES-2135]MBD2368305.1 hypothetical protein [Leptolyngbya sp. FACHB-161]MBD2374655.1 hypothetical protein [Leptolyngbya sp. FACHB-238]MBD2399077.1 hypothetical protein [Leptolyngbya sp. FACHB-239]MBD2405083.1 hypothetical protein [Leptolyngbya sp. FACHB-402]